MNDIISKFWSQWYIIIAVDNLNMSSSRNFIKEPKLSKPTSRYYGDAPLSGRTMN